MKELQLKLIRVFGICFLASLLLATAEGLVIIAGARRLPPEVALGIFFSELGLALLCFILFAIGGVAIARIMKLDAWASVLRAICLAFPLLFGFHWITEIVTPETLSINLFSYCIIGLILFIAWISLALRSRGGAGFIELRSFAYIYWFIFSVASMLCFSLFTNLQVPHKYFPVFYAFYALCFLITGNAVFKRYVMGTKEGKWIKGRAIWATALISIAILPSFAYAKRSYIDRKPRNFSGKVETTAKGKPNVILISLDTLRADHLSCYGYHKETSPRIDSLAEHGVKFEHAISQAPWTLPSHSSLFTSRYPYQLEQHKIGDMVSITEVLKMEGYTTVGFTGGIFMRERDFGKAFDFFDDQVEENYLMRQAPCLLSSLIHIRRFGRRFGLKISSLNKTNKWRFIGPDRILCSAQLDAIRKASTGWLREHGRKNSFFMFLHTYSIHEYYLNRETARENARTFNPGYTGIFDGNNLDYNSQFPDREEDVEQIVALYDGEILDADKEIGLFCQELERLGLWENTLLILTSDHGEGFAPTLGRTWHRDRLNEDLIRVPLIFVYPKEFPAGSSVTSQAALIDLMPTILDLLGINPPNESDLEGTSLMPLIRSARRDTDEARHIYSEVADVDKIGASLRTQRHKYIMYPNHVEIYDLQHDPKERINLGMRELEGTPEIKRLLGTFYEKSKSDVEYDREVIDQMKSVGYLQ